jgi:heme-degrading monooxygenase HmoA
MVARVSTYKAEDGEKLLEGFRTVTDELEEIAGFSQAFFLVDRSGGKAMAITMWESEDALNASAEQAGRLRERGSEAGGGTIESVDNYEVGMTVGHGAAA